MNTPILHDDLLFALRSADSDPERTVRLAPVLAERVRVLAVELLRHALMLVSIRITGEPPTPDTPYMIWQALQEGPQMISEQEATNFDALASECDGWILVNEDELAFVEMDEWLRLYPAWIAQHATPPPGTRESR